MSGITAILQLWIYINEKILIQGLMLWDIFPICHCCSFPLGSFLCLAWYIVCTLNSMQYNIMKYELDGCGSLSVSMLVYLGSFFTADETFPWWQIQCSSSKIWNQWFQVARQPWQKCKNSSWVYPGNAGYEVEIHAEWNASTSQSNMRQSVYWYVFVWWKQTWETKRKPTET